MGLFVAFSGFLGYLLMADQAPGCGCFGRQLTFGDARTDLIIGFVRNLIFLLFGACFFWFARGEETLGEGDSETAGSPGVQPG